MMLKKEKIINTILHSSNYSLPEFLDEYKDFLNDRDVCLALVMRKGTNLEFLDFNIKNNDEIVEKAIKNNPSAFKYASDELKGNKEFVLSVVNCLGFPYEEISKPLMDDEDFIAKAFEENANYYLMKYISERLKDNEDFLLTLMDKMDILAYASDRLKDKEDFVKHVLKRNTMSIYHISERLKDNKEIILGAIRACSQSSCSFCLDNASNRLKSDKILVLEIVNKNGLALRYASEELQNDEEIVSVAVKKNPLSLRYVHPRLKNNKQLVMQAVKDNPEVFEYRGTQLIDDEDIALLAIKGSYYNIEFLGEKLKTNKNILDIYFNMYKETQNEIKIWINYSQKNKGLFLNLKNNWEIYKEGEWMDNNLSTKIDKVKIKKF